MLYNRASADPAGNPWSERKKYMYWGDAEAKEVGRPGHSRLPRRRNRRSTSPRKPGARRRRRACPGSDPFIMQPDGKAWLFAPAGLADGPLPAHYEPQESPFRQPALRPAAQPGPGDHQAHGEPAAAQRHRAGLVGVPLRGHHLPADPTARGMPGTPPYLSELLTSS